MSAPTLSVLKLAAIAPTDETIPVGPAQVVHRSAGEALHPERLSLDALTALRAQMGERVFGAQYLMEPVPIDGWIVRWDWFGSYSEIRAVGGTVIQSWDTAYKTGSQHDYSACVTCLYLEDTVYVLDVIRERMEFPTLLRRVPEHAGRWQADEVIIEDTSSGTALIQAHQGKWPFRVWPNVPRGDKETRLRVETPIIEAGRVLLKTGAPWIEDLHREVTTFPRGQHDDIVDALSQALKRIRLRGFPKSRFTPIGRRRLGSVLDFPDAHNPGGLSI